MLVPEALCESTLPEPVVQAVLRRAAVLAVRRYIITVAVEPTVAPNRLSQISSEEAPVMRTELLLDLLVDRVVDLAAPRRADCLGRCSADCDLPGHLQVVRQKRRRHCREADDRALGVLEDQRGCRIAIRCASS